MTKFLCFLNQKYIQNKRGKLLYFLGLGITFIIFVVLLILLFLSSFNSSLFFTDRNSFDYAKAKLTENYPQNVTQFLYSNGDYKYYFSYSLIGNDGVAVAVDMKKGSSESDRVQYILESGKVSITYFDSSDYSTTFSQSKKGLKLINSYQGKFAQKLTDSQLNLAQTSIHLSNTVLDKALNYAFPNTGFTFSAVLSEYLVYNSTVTTLMNCSIIFMIIFFLLTATMITFYVLAERQNKIIQ